MKLFYFTILALAFTACTIQKRTVNKGYFVQWHFKQKAAKAKVTSLPDTELSVIQAESPPEIPEISPADSLPSISAEQESTQSQDLPENTVSPKAIEEHFPSFPAHPLLSKKLAERKNLHQKITAPKDDDLYPARSKAMYVFRGIWNLLLILLVLFSAYILFILLLFTSDLVILFLIMACLHIIVCSFFKSLAFFKMSRIKGREEAGDRTAAAEAKKLQRKIKRTRQNINLVFLAFYLILAIFLFAFMN